MPAPNLEEYSKNQRMTASATKREKSRNLLLNKRRGLLPPVLLSIVPINDSANVGAIQLRIIQECTTMEDGVHQFEKERYQIVPCSQNKISILDTAKVADQLVFVASCSGLDFTRSKLSPESCNPFSPWAYELLTLLRAQGLPNISVVIQDLPTNKH